MQVKAEEMEEFYKQRRNKDSEKLTVHVGPHSHLDVGWLKTVDELWSGHDYGVKKSLKIERVEYTFDSVVMEMERDPLKTFSFAEVKWIKRWYSRQSKQK
jgi:hypothetical protein